MNTIPENLTEFLYWVKEKTETLWSEDLETSDSEEWIHDAKWIPLTDQQIEEVERKYSIQFTPDHKEFLRVLHAIDRKEKYKYTESLDDDAKILVGESHFFINWLGDENEIKDILNLPFKDVLRDIFSEFDKPYWCKSWGQRPENKDEVVKLFANLYEKAPKLVPLTYLTFVVSDMSLKHQPILSVYATDILVCGWTLKTYLLHKIGRNYLQIKEQVFDEEDQRYYSEFIGEAQQSFDKDFKYDEMKIIPFWQDIILSYNTGWKGFGMKSPF